ncbi:MAG TPA: hypothetical protein VF079_00225 [Sphingomicrobium sp.]
MTDSRVALGMDRLPWLPDEPVRSARPPTAAKPTRVGLLGWSVAAMLAVAGGAYWFGLNSGTETLPDAASTETRPEATFQLPKASPSPSPSAAPPKIEPIVAPPIPIVEQPIIKYVTIERVIPKSEPAPPADDAAAAAAPVADETAADTETAAEATVQPPPAPVARPVYTGPWPVRVVEGASGRMVRIGAFRTAHQAKKGWWAIVKMNPALKHLPALVVPVQSYRNGQVYYRLQMGTTSQAHSTVLCQRMRMIGQSCVVIDERRA